MPQYIEVHADLMNHPKVKRVSRALNIPPVYVRGHLQSLWLWAMNYAPNGDITRYDAEDIAEAAEWTGDARVFVDALLSCGIGGGKGLIERTPGGLLLIHDWHEYGGKILITRFQDTFRKKHNRQPTTDEIRAAGLFPPEMWGAAEGITGNPEAEKTLPQDSNGFQWIPQDSDVEEKSLEEPSLAQPTAHAHEGQGEGGQAPAAVVAAASGSVSVKEPDAFDPTAPSEVFGLPRGRKPSGQHSLPTPSRESGGGDKLTARVAALEAAHPDAVAWVLWRAEESAECPPPYLPYRRALLEKVASGQIPRETYAGFNAEGGGSGSGGNGAGADEGGSPAERATATGGDGLDHTPDYLRHTAADRFTPEEIAAARAYRARMDAEDRARAAANPIRRLPTPERVAAYLGVGRFTVVPDPAAAAAAPTASTGAVLQ